MHEICLQWGHKSYSMALGKDCPISLKGALFIIRQSQEGPLSIKFHLT